jgi:pantoate--beta-alanine ligase
LRRARRAGTEALDSVKNASGVRLGPPPRFITFAGSMELIRTVTDMQELAQETRAEGRTLALVPTMGALHDGHLRLIDEAKIHSDHVTVSIFINPTQFGPGEDYERYPRVLEDDLAMLDRKMGVDVVFVPSVEEMYPGGEAENRTWVSVEGLTDHLCGPHRPGHFRGVATVVAKLFHACRPQVAVFGLKDAQQFVILRRMARDLHFGVRMVGVPTVREADGLAMSSRNAYLSPVEREQAVVLSQAVLAGAELVRSGEQHPEAIVETIRYILAQALGAIVQYAELVDAENLQPLGRIHPGQEVITAVAVFFGKTRLIDSSFVKAPM